jgi:hypothetical protein
MKKQSLTLVAALLAIAGTAQTLNVTVGGNVTYAYPAEITGEIGVSNNNTFVINGKEFTADNTLTMSIDQSEVTDNTVTVSINDTDATVVVAGNIAPYITATIDGAHVVINQSEEVGDNTCGEITYTFAGSSTNGSITLNGDYKATIELTGLTLTNPNGAALSIKDGKRIEMSVKKGTTNTLIDGADGSQKGCIDCKGHLELKGKGTLNVTGNTGHAIFSKEYLEMKNCTVNVLGAVKDGVNCNQYFLMESGELNIKNVDGDGIQASYKDDSNREEEDTGELRIAGGTITAAISGRAAKALKADGDIVITDGTLTLSVSGTGEWDSTDKKTKASACLGCDGDLNIEGGTLSLTATGNGGKGASCDGALNISGGDITVKTSGGVYAYVSNKEYDGYTGSTDRLSSNQKSSPKGMKADGNVNISGGNITVTTTGNGSEGIESKKVLTVDGGTIYIKSYDDCINSSSTMNINGGDITVISSSNDGLDANGNMYITGGYTRAFGAKSPECGIDVNSESGYCLYFTGGTLIGVGGSNSTPSKSSSTQPYVTGSLSVSGGQTITLKSGTTELASFEVPTGYSMSGSSSGGGGWGGGFGGGSSSGGVIVTCPGLTSGSSYTLSNGTSSTTVTARTTGSSSGSGRP